MAAIKHGLSGSREYQREALRKWRSEGHGNLLCECGGPATVRYMGAKVCVTCYSRQKHRDFLVDEKERWKALREKRHIAAKKASAKRWEKYAKPFEAYGLKLNTLTVDEKAALVLDSLRHEERNVS